MKADASLTNVTAHMARWSAGPNRLVFGIGGNTPNLPRVEMTMLDCHLELPAHSIDDVISLETSFSALPSNIDNTDELTVKYFGKDV